MRERTVQFVNIGATRSRAAWTVVATRSPLEQVLIAVLFIILAIPLFLLLVALGVVLAVVASAGMLYLAFRTIVRRLLSSDSTNARMRENVRVIGSNERA